MNEESGEEGWICSRGVTVAKEYFTWKEFLKKFHDIEKQKDKMLEVDSYLEGNMATDHDIKKILAPYQSERKALFKLLEQFLKMRWKTLRLEISGM